MASLMENLIEVLNKQYEIYEQLLALSTTKTTAIVKGNLEDLARITDEEQNVVAILGRYDKERDEVMKDIANVINKDVEGLRIATLAQMLSGRPEEQRQLNEVGDKLRDVAFRMKKVNEQNKELLENSLEMVAFDMNLLQAMRQAPETANYNKGAYSTGTTMGSAPGTFDAKQ